MFDLETAVLPLSLRAALVLALAVVLSACATSTVAPYVRPASGFELIDSNEDGLRWRLALIDSARYSIDVQYYLWYGDTAGRFLAKRLLDAADRGVKARKLVDDLNTLFRTS